MRKLLNSVALPLSVNHLTDPSTMSYSPVAKYLIRICRDLDAKPYTSIAKSSGRILNNCLYLVPSDYYLCLNMALLLMILLVKIRLKRSFKNRLSQFFAIRSQPRVSMRVAS